METALWILVVVGCAAVGVLYAIAQTLDKVNARLAEVNRRLDALADIALGRRP